MTLNSSVHQLLKGIFFSQSTLKLYYACEDQRFLVFQKVDLNKESFRNLKQNELVLHLLDWTETVSRNNYKKL